MTVNFEFDKLNKAKPRTATPKLHGPYRRGSLLRLELLRLLRLIRDPLLARLWAERTKQMRPISLRVRPSLALSPRSYFICLIPDTSLVLLLFASGLPFSWLTINHARINSSRQRGGKKRIKSQHPNIIPGTSPFRDRRVVGLGRWSGSCGDPTRTGRGWPDRVHV